MYVLKLKAIQTSICRVSNCRLICKNFLEVAKNMNLLRMQLKEKLKR